VDTNGHGELRRKLERHVTKSECPFCGLDVWNGMDRRVALIPLDDDGNALVGRGRGVFALACDGCGFVRFHDEQIVLSKA
jgi:hypothetical protein